ncbi:uncharacterized protein LOC123505358 [Portunus trituberculatus]|uniref:uncharacterized protein LOC123505358 n=1 Tax=Portunus trituberculatus TaxID=210409 RepID=UPI001E1D0C42|nr:uncharacterized protein LOC123505358 [Portunus trituberculatus]
MDRMIWLAEVVDKHRNLSVTPRLTAKTVIAVTKDKDTVKFLTKIGHPYDSGIMKWTEITSENQRTKLMIRNYPSFLPLTFIENLPSVLKAERNYHRDTKTPRNQVTVLWEGEPPTQLYLPSIRPLRVESYIGKPTFCGKCQEWGHRAWECDKKVRCGASRMEPEVSQETCHHLSARHANDHSCPTFTAPSHIRGLPTPTPGRTPAVRSPASLLSDPPSPLPPDTVATTTITSHPAPPPYPPSSPLVVGSTPPSTAPLLHPTKPPASQAQDRPPYPHASQALQEELSHPPQLQMPGQPFPHPAPLPPQMKPPHTQQSQNSTHVSHITSKLEEEVKILCQEVKQLWDSQAALQKENQELRQQMATSMKNMESEISSMRAMMAQLLQNVTGTKPKQHRDEPRGVTEATVAATSKTATVTPTPKQTAVKEHQQPARQEESLVTDATTVRLGRRYQVFYQPYRQGGSRGLVTLVRKDIPAALTENPHDLGEQVDTLCVTLHLGRTYKLNIYNVYCRQRSTLDLLPLLEDPNMTPTLLSGDFNAHHPLHEPWGDGNVNQRGRHITQVLEDFAAAAVLHGEPRPTHIAGGRLDLIIMVNGDGQNMDVEGVPELLNYKVPESTQQFASDLTRAIQDAADASMPTRGMKKYNPNKKYCWYYNDRVNLLTRMTRQLTKVYQSTKNEDDKANLQEWNIYAREQLNKIREEKWLTSMATLSRSTSMTAAWKKINNVGVTTATHLPDDTDHQVTREELLRARKPSKDTAPREDGITYSMLNHVCDVAGDPLLRLFNMSLTHGEVPEEWTTANIIPIPKHNDQCKFRPISLTSTICKMMERILLRRLQYKIGKFDAGINGFVQNRSTANCLVNYTSNAKAKTEVFIDIEKAFDRAQPTVILHELTKLGVKGKLLTWIKQYLTNRRARVIFQGHASHYHTLENGTPQGSVMSPTLFNVLMNVLATLPYPAGTQHIGYADDIVLQTTEKDSVTKMQASLDILANKCDTIGFTISHSKTKAMAKTRRMPQTKLRLQGQEIDWGLLTGTSALSYLGMAPARPRCNILRRNAVPGSDYYEPCHGEAWEPQAPSSSPHTKPWCAR